LVAHPKAHAHFVQPLPPISARNVDEGVEIGRRVRQHGRKVVLEQVSLSDMPHGAADLDRPTPPIESPGRARINDNGRDIRRRITGPHIEVAVV